MKLDMERSVEVPSGVEVELKGSNITAKSGGKETKRVFESGNIKITKEGSKIMLKTEKGTKREGRMMGTIAAHIKNMMAGFKDNYVYKLEICNVHFPMTAKVDGETIRIKTFLGEKTDRVARIVPGEKIEIKGNVITVSSHDKEAAGQTAANLEKATWIKNRDRRVFQDGIFVTESCGRAM